jgi:hypothetical protein
MSRRFPERRLDVEAFGCLDVLEVDATHRWSEHLAEPDDVVGVGGIDLEVENVDVGEALEEHRLALHDRLSGQSANVAEAEDGTPVRDHRHQVAPVGVSERRIGVVGDRQAGVGHSGGVGQTQIRLGGGRFGGPDLQLSRARFLVIFERFGELGLGRHR